MRVLITGITGFVGPYLAEHILTRHAEHEVWGLAWGEVGREQLARLQPTLRLVEGDLTRPDSVQDALRVTLPELVFHLAAASSVASSWASPTECLRVNALGQVHLFEGLRALDISPVTVVSSSAEVYGRVAPEHLPVREEQPLEPVTPYGVSKAVQDLVAHQYFAAHGLPTVRLRLFNHTGPRRPEHFVLSSFAHQIAAIELGRRPPRVVVGDLEVVRDFTDVRDVARAYWLAATDGLAGGAYNVCSGHPVRVGDALDLLRAMSRRTFAVEIDPARLRAAEIPALYGDRSRFTQATGWEPNIPLAQTLADLLAWCREHV